MVFHEGRDEIIAVVVALLHAQGERDVGGTTGGVKQLRLQLTLQEAVRGALVDEQIVDTGAVLNQGDGVVSAPKGPIRDEVAAERLLPPRHPRRRRDRREGGDASVAAGILEGDGERAVTA